MSPGSGWDLGVWTRRVLSEWSPDSVGCVEVRMERDRVEHVALQSAEALMNCAGGMRIIERIRNRPGENGIRTDLNEGAHGGCGGGDRITEPNRVAQVRHPVIRAE